MFAAAPEAKPRGVCVLLSGQTEFFEKYAEVIGELNGRGFTVASFDWRGQGGSQRLLANALKAHVGDFTQYDDDLLSFMEKIVKPLAERPPLALAHSMGGHILLRALHDRPNLFAAAVFSAPMLRAQSRGYPPWLARALTWLQYTLGRKDEWVIGMAARDPLHMEFDANLVTSDRTRFARARALIASNPDIRLAGPTWGWLEQAYRAMKAMQAPGYPENIRTPILLVAAGRDRLVDTTVARGFARRLPQASYVEIEDAEHEILMEADPIRARFWQAFDAFTEKLGI